MNGGVGNDSYFVENAGDKVVEAVNQGTDSVSSRLTFTLPANVENLTLTDTSAINGTGNGLANVMAGNVASNQLSGLAGNDILSGGGGNDILMGGAGTNILTGGVGNDIFRFTASGNTGTVTDYNVANDTIQLENGVFKALTATGTLPASQFRVGAQALDGNDHVIYNKTTGALIYDANGSGAGAAVQIGTLTPGLNLTNLDIVVI
ncbi:MAG: calcium-binding protein, partial [Nitrosomonas sp.]